MSDFYDKSKENLEALHHKYSDLGLDLQTMLKGLLHAKPITYWDYVEVDTLLTLQKPRTNFSDEPIFIVYHQVTELVLKLIVHELEQITAEPTPAFSTISMKLKRINQYISLLSSSFSIMNQGMELEQYNQFRLSLAPASGFQSFQFRLIEFYCTDIDNLIHPMRRASVPEGAGFKDKFSFLYWQEAGYNRETGKKTMTLSLFEEKYLDKMLEAADRLKDRNLNRLANSFDFSGEDGKALRESLRDFDRMFNISWPMVHLETARTYLGQGPDRKAATGGSDWVKYLHPSFQQRRFFPELWTEQEKLDWGKEG